MRRDRVVEFDPPVEFRVEVDSEGVCRVSDCTVKVLKLSPTDLGRLLTALLKAVTGSGEASDFINVSLN
jgi:hypothetical protein